MFTFAQTDTATDVATKVAKMLRGESPIERNGHGILCEEHHDPANAPATHVFATVGSHSVIWFGVCDAHSEIPTEIQQDLDVDAAVVPIPPISNVRHLSHDLTL